MRADAVEHVERRVAILEADVYVTPEDDRFVRELSEVRRKLAITVFGRDRLVAPRGTRVRPRGCDAAATAPGRSDDVPSRVDEFAPHVRERCAHGRRDLDHRALQFRLNVVPESLLGERQQHRLAGDESARRRVDDLIFFFDAEREGVDCG